MGVKYILWLYEGSFEEGQRVIYLKMIVTGFLAAALCALVRTQKVTYQAESATLDGVTVGTSVAGFSGKNWGCGQC